MLLEFNIELKFIELTHSRYGLIIHFLNKITINHQTIMYK